MTAIRKLACILAAAFAGAGIVWGSLRLVNLAVS